MQASQHLQKTTATAPWSVAINMATPDGTILSKVPLHKLPSADADLGTIPSNGPDLYAPSTDTAYDITALSAYASANVTVSSKAPVLNYFTVKPKSISDTALDYK